MYVRLNMAVKNANRKKVWKATTDYEKHFTHIWCLQNSIIPDLKSFEI